MVSAESTSSTAGPATADWAWRDGEVVQLVFQLHDKAFGELFAHAGNARQLRMILRADGLHRALGREAAEDLDGQLRAYSADGDEPLEEAFLFAIEKAEEGDLVFAHLRVDVQRSLRAHARQRGKRRHGDDHVVSNAGGLDDGLARFFVNQLAAKMRDHLRLLYVRDGASSQV